MTNKLPDCKRLDSIRNVRREAAVIYRAARSGDLDVAEASKLVNILSIIGRLIQGDELEKRIEALESNVQH
jgi:hypothetical protein